MLVRTDEIVLAAVESIAKAATVRMTGGSDLVAPVDVRLRGGVGVPKQWRRSVSANTLSAPRIR